MSERNRNNRNKRNKCSLVVKVSKEFADSTSMHGLKFIATKDATIEERFNQQIPIIQTLSISLLFNDFGFYKIEFCGSLYFVVDFCLPFSSLTNCGIIGAITHFKSLSNLPLLRLIMINNCLFISISFTDNNF